MLPVLPVVQSVQVPVVPMIVIAVAFSESVQAICVYVMPTGLLEVFEGEALEEGNTLNWTVSSELQASGFTIERALHQPVNFEAIGRVSTKSGYAYAFEDASPGYRSYYRIVARNENGGATLSRVIEVVRPGHALQGARIYPNPTTDMLNLDFEPNAAEVLQFEIINMVGKQLQEGTLEAQAGAQRHQLSVETLPAGMYSLILYQGAEVVRRKFIKQ